MLYPTTSELNSKTNSRYSLVMLAAKRARDIIDGKPIFVDSVKGEPSDYADVVIKSGDEIKEGKLPASRAVTIAVEEISRDIINYKNEEVAEDADACSDENGEGTEAAEDAAGDIAEDAAETEGQDAVEE